MASLRRSPLGARPAPLGGPSQALLELRHGQPASPLSRGLRPGFGNWRDALRAAGLERGQARGGPGARGYERRALLESLRDAWAERSDGRHLTQTAYAAWRLEQRGSLPPAVTLAKTFGSWPDALLGARLIDPPRAGELRNLRQNALPDEALLDQLASALSALGEEASISQYAAWPHRAAAGAGLRAGRELVLPGDSVRIVDRGEGIGSPSAARAARPDSKAGRT